MDPNDEFISIFINPHYRDILNITRNSPKSRIAICEEGHIPDGSFSRLVNRLIKYDLLEIIHRENNSDEDTKYHSKIKGCTITFDGTDMKITRIPN